jgi:hypothetical protein
MPAATSVAMAPPPPPPAQPMAKAEPLFEEPAPFEAEAPQSLADLDLLGGMAEARARIELEGKLVALEPHRLVITVAVGSTLEWIVPQSVHAVLDDGSRHTLRVDAKLTTRAGTLERGHVLRLVLVLDTALGSAPRALELGGPEAILVRLARA